MGGTGLEPVAFAMSTQRANQTAPTALEIVKSYLPCNALTNWAMSPNFLYVLAHSEHLLPTTKDAFTS